MAKWGEPPATWDKAALHSFIIRVVNSVLHDNDLESSPINESQDLFEQGCNSLQATYIRVAIAWTLCQAPTTKVQFKHLPTRVPQNLVYYHPTIPSLVAYMDAILHSVEEEAAGEPDRSTRTTENMHMLVEKYSQDYPTHHPIGTKGHSEILLLTGSSGRLGTYLLQNLLCDDRVDRVFAVNRQSAKLRLVAVNISEEDLGLDQELLQEICVSITSIIQNAWRVDFNLSLSAFGSNIQFTRSGLNLALKTQTPVPAQFIFTSSIGTVANWAKPGPVPEAPLTDPGLAIGSGYSESKWVSEQLIIAAAEQRGLKATILRIGQLASSIQNGAWNTTDWLPLMPKSGATFGVLPSFSRCVSWLPVDKAAQSIIEVMHGRATESRVDLTYLNVAHPHAVHWDLILESIAKTLHCELVPSHEWMQRLNESADRPTDIEGNPAIKLLDFFRRACASSEGIEDNRGYERKEAMGVPDLETAGARARSETLGQLRPLDQKDADRWLAYWINRGLFSF
ncbi:NAD(P)-binding protein [Calocera cornea HHB12733]|uniref:NAD(P)-binding protein n=1 Tax=Calocera cornea HHB12733 TaxID=1353952 RepID=A0A165C469_9BASI|nr:NAD(P)-binding protein [Calocera cornea HHB12733]